MSDLLTRLKQRKLVQWALAYLAAAWVLLQVLGQIGDSFGWPDVALRVITVALGFGLLPVLVLAWYHGERGQQRASRTELIALALLVVAGTALLMRVARPVAEPAEAAATYNQTSRPDSTTIATVAVLPFVNTSGDPQDEYFSDGLTDELAHALSRLAALRVAGRASSYAFKGQAVASQKIGAALAVAGVISGTVRRSGQRLRVTAELTSAADGKVLWSNVYESTKRDVFEVQDSFTRAIVRALAPRLSGTAGSRGTEDPVAYDLYLKGHFFWAKRGARSLPRAAQYFREAIARDSQFARAHAGLSMAYGVLPYYQVVTIDSLTPLALAAARRALVLDSMLSDAHLALGIALRQQMRLVDAEASIAHALELAPTDAHAHHQLGLTLDAQGRVEDALAAKKRAAALDPLSPLMATNVGMSAMYSGDFRAAIVAHRRAIELDSTFTRAYFNAARAYVFAGAADSAIHALEAGRRIGPWHQGARGLLSFAFGAAGRWSEARRIHDEIVRPGVAASNADIAVAEIAVGNDQAALAAVERAINGHELLAAFGSPGCDPVFGRLRSERRFQNLLRRYGMRWCPPATSWPIAPRPR